MPRSGPPQGQPVVMRFLLSDGHLPVGLQERRFPHLPCSPGGCCPFLRHAVGRFGRTRPVPGVNAFRDRYSMASSRAYMKWRLRMFRSRASRSHSREMARISSGRDRSGQRGAPPTRGHARASSGSASGDNRCGPGTYCSGEHACKASLAGM